MIANNLLSIIPEKIARKYNVIPIRLENETLIIGGSEENIYTIQDLKMITGKRIVFEKYSQEEIVREIECAYGNRIEVDEDYAKRILCEILNKAVKENASDIHIEPFDSYLSIRLRVDGELHEAFRYSLDLYSSLTAVIKLKSGIDITEKRLPQDGRADINIDGRSIDIRTSTIPTTYGEKTVLRILNRDNFFKTKEEIGFSNQAIAMIDKMISNKSGIILIVGETGCGKSTTLYSILKDLNVVSRNIITIEDPVEYKMDGINQIQVNEKVGLTFEKGLRAILRQDPDIIMLGEIRDSETAKIAVRASITGHLVLSTLHTNDTVSSITRLKDMGVDLYLISASLVGIISQRLVKKVCPYCGGKVEKCEYCGGKGYLGRTVVYEILEIDEAIRECISDFEKNNRIKDVAIERGKMITFDQCYRALVQKNLIKSF
ncbi:MAG: GspE/PulE family protein [Intestinibacter sp.]|uniref:GspE/PulE family protein n=1 Tax=Intestinibacter sp. TaxID=1965304 RepID=UPI0025C380F6|nr:GspE/PulE family protein [Intestinibacter sp.]MCI6738318.1 GspE/PulE family protein [Intestinibacter sp.]